MNGKWICALPSVETPMFKKVFAAEEIASAKIDISGLGFFTLLVNGKRVTDDLFTPALTDYRPRDTSKFYYPIFDKFTHRVLYMTYDVTAFLKEGEMIDLVLTYQIKSPISSVKLPGNFFIHYPPLLSMSPTQLYTSGDALFQGKSFPHTRQQYQA